MPTYKFDVRLKTYDQKKTPSWYDRILYQTVDQKKLSVLRYNDIDVYLSDHKPVYAMFSILVRKENLEMKQKFVQTYLMGWMGFKMHYLREITKILYFPSITVLIILIDDFFQFTLLFIKEIVLINATKNEQNTIIFAIENYRDIQNQPWTFISLMIFSLCHKLVKLWQKVPIFCRVLLTRHQILVQLVKLHVRLPVQVWRENSSTQRLQHLDYHSLCASVNYFLDLFVKVNQEVSEVQWYFVKMLGSPQFLALVDLSTYFLHI